MIHPDETPCVPCLHCNARSSGSGKRGESHGPCAASAVAGSTEAPVSRGSCIALVTFHAEATLSEGITCSIARGSATVAGLHPAAGGDGTELCSADMLLESLASCVGVTLKSVATSMGAHARGGHIAVDGDLDFRGTLAVERDVAVGFTSIRSRSRSMRPRPRAAGDAPSPHRALLRGLPDGSLLAAGADELGDDRAAGPSRDVRT